MDIDKIYADNNGNLQPGYTTDGLHVSSGYYPLWVDYLMQQVNEIIRWLTGYTNKELERMVKKPTSYEEFFGNAPCMNEKRKLIKGMICGVRVQEVTPELMREIRYLDKLIDELAKGKPMEKILRK